MAQKMRFHYKSTFKMHSGNSVAKWKKNSCNVKHQKFRVQIKWKSMQPIREIVGHPTNLFNPYRVGNIFVHGTIPSTDSIIHDVSSSQFSL